VISTAVVPLLPRKSIVLESGRAVEHIRVKWVNVEVSWVASKKDNYFLNFINGGAFPA
jgi:hypothetical protein